MPALCTHPLNETGSTEVSLAGWVDPLWWLIFPWTMLCLFELSPLFGEANIYYLEWLVPACEWGLLELFVRFLECCNWEVRCKNFEKASDLLLLLLLLFKGNIGFSLFLNFPFKYLSIIYGLISVSLIKIRMKF